MEGERVSGGTVSMDKRMYRAPGDQGGTVQLRTVMKGTAFGICFLLGV